MNKLAKIFLTINPILGYFYASHLPTTATFSSLLTFRNDPIIAAAEEGLFDALAVETVEEPHRSAAHIFIFTFLFILLLASVVSTVVPLKRCKIKISLHVNIVLALTSSGFGVAGGIIGLIALNKENNQNYVDNPIDN